MSPEAISPTLDRTSPAITGPMPHRESKPDADFPISERMADRCISLPMFPEMTDEEVEFVISDTRQVLMTGGRQS